MTHTYNKILGNKKQEIGTISHYLDRHDVATKAQEIIETKKQEIGTKFFIIAKGSQNTIFLEEVVKSLLAHSEDASKLTRQGSRRENKK